MTTASSVRTSWPGPPRRRRRAERVRWNGMRLLLGLVVVAVGCVAAIGFIQAVAFPGRSAGARPIDIASLLPKADVSASTTAEPTARIENSGAVVHDGAVAHNSSSADRRVVPGSPVTTSTPARPSPASSATRTRAPRHRSAADPSAHGTRSTPTADDESADERSGSDQDDSDQDDPDRDDPDGQSGPSHDGDESQPDQDDTTTPSTNDAQGDGLLPAPGCLRGRAAEEIRDRDSGNDGLGGPDRADCR